VYVLRGQGWITLTSMVEGTSHVTVVAPEVYGWDARLKSAMVHWIDAAIQYPAPAINQAGTRHVFTTTVPRQTNHTPCEGWRVKYTIAGGPPAGFAPDGIQTIEAPTNSAGQASAEIFQQQPAHGTNRITMEVIRPGELPGAAGRRLTVGTGATTMTWTAADLAVKVSGPASGAVGSTLRYRIEVSNPGDLPAKEIAAAVTVPEGLSYVGGNPPSEGVGRQLQWRLGDLGARQQRLIEADFRADGLGSARICCEVTGAGGLKASDGATTTRSQTAPAGLLSPSPIDVRVISPASAKVGEKALFNIEVTNRGQSPSPELDIQVRFDPGLEHENARGQNSIKQKLGALAAGESRKIGVEYRVTKAGTLCQTVEVAGLNLAAATARGCVTALGDAAAPDRGFGDWPSFGQTPAMPLTVTMIGPDRHVAGETARFTIEVKNNGNAPLANVKIVDQYDASLFPTDATGGFELEGRNLVWTIENLPAGKTAKYEILCRCQTASMRACNRAIATLPDGRRAEGEACLEIVEPSASKPETPPLRPPGDDWELSVVGTTSPVIAGKELTYVVTVTNKGMTPHRNVIVRATAPAGMTFNLLSTSGPAGLQFTRVGHTLRFDPVSELRPGESLTYRVRVLAKEPDTHRFRVELVADDLPRGIEKEAVTEVFRRP